MLFCKVIFFAFLLPVMLLSQPVVTDKPVTSATLLLLAYEAEEQGEITRALAYYQQAKHVLDKQEYALHVYICDKISCLYSKNFEAATARLYLDSAQDLLSVKLYENDSLIAQTWYTAGIYFDYAGKPDSALYYHQKAFKLRKALHIDNPIAVANSLQSIGEVYLYGYQNYYEAEQNLEPAMRLWETHKGPDRLTISCYYNLAVANRRKGDFLKALSYAYKTLNSNKISALPDPYNLSATYSLIGTIYFDMGEPKKALVYNDTAISLSVQYNLSGNLPLHYNNHGNYYLSAGQYDSVIIYCQKALHIPSNQVYLANSYHLLGLAYQKQHQTTLAFLNFFKSLGIKQAIYPDRNSQLANLYLDMGETYEETLRWDSALYYYNRALYSTMLSQYQAVVVSTDSVILQEGDDLNLGLKAVQGKADLLLSLYKKTREVAYLEKAYQQYKLFDKAVDLNRISFDMESSKLLLSDAVKKTYENAIECGYQLFQITHDPRLNDIILAYMEKNKAMVLYESVQRSEAYEKALPDSLYLLERSLQAQLAFHRAELTSIQTLENNNAALVACHNKIAETERKIQQLNYLIQDEFPNYFQARYGSQMVNIDTIQNHITDKQVVISYFWGNAAVYALVITTHTSAVHKITDLPRLKKAVNTYQTLLTQKYSDEQAYKNFQAYQENALVLYNLLLSPFLKGISTDQLTLVPDGPLSAIPFESLITHPVKSEYANYKKLPFLIYEYEIVSEFSLNLAFRDIFDNRPGTDNEDVKVIAYGIQQFDFMPAGGPRYTALPGVKKEIQHIHALFPQASIFLDQQATESNFKKNAGAADILHLATHGKANLENPFLSNFTFARDSTGENDGVLNLYEIYGTSLKAKLLLLSSCESGVGKDYPGEGNYSLARSFIYAGCQSVIMTLWSIQDEVTNELVQNFYTYLQQTGEVTAALRQTKLAYLAKTNAMGARPQLWAGLVPLGKAKIHFQQNYLDFTTWGIILALIVFIIMLIRKPVWQLLHRQQVHN